MKPSIMLLDEPTSALDVEMVREVLGVMQELAQSRMTTLTITHELGFAREAADRIIFFDEGQIVEDRPPEEFLRAPRHSRAKRFLERVLQTTPGRPGRRKTGRDPRTRQEDHSHHQQVPHGQARLPPTGGGGTGAAGSPNKTGADRN